MNLAEMLARLAALIQGAEGRSFTDAEVTEIEGLETDIATARAQEQRDADIRARHADRQAPRGPRPATARVTETPAPYDMAPVTNRITGEVEYRFAARQDHDFSTDLHAMANARDGEGDRTEAGARVMAAFRRVLNADIDTADINELNPEIDRQDMYVDQRDYRTPIMDLIGRGAPPNGVQPFRFPKFSSATGLVGNHTEGVEPASGTLVTTSDVVNPTALSGKASITREVWDMGGNPAVSGLVFNQMVRGYREGLETAAATFLNTLTAAADLTVTTAAVDDALSASVEGHIAALVFERGYDFSAFVLEKVLYTKLAAARDDMGRPIYPLINPANANGQVSNRFRLLNIAGLTGIPSWALASTAGSPNNSWIFDPSTVYGWWTPPQRLEFPGSDPSDTPPSYAPVAYVDLAVWGYKAFANTDIGGVRQVIYDSVA